MRIIPIVPLHHERTCDSGQSHVAHLECRRSRQLFFTSHNPVPSCPGLTPNVQKFLSMSVKVTSTLPCLLPSPTTCQNCRGRNLTCGVVLPKLPLVSTSSGLGNGLRTPPVDDMSTAYQPAMPTYEGHTLSGYPSALSHSSHIKPVVDDARNSHSYRYSSQQVQLRNGPYLSTEPAADPMLRQPPSSLTPVTESSVAAKRSHSTTPRRGSETLIYHSLQMPKCISHTGGNLSDFAAQVGCILLYPRLRVQTMTGVLTRIGGLIDDLFILVRVY